VWVTWVGREQPSKLRVGYNYFGGLSDIAAAVLDRFFARSCGVGLSVAQSGARAARQKCA